MIGIDTNVLARSYTFDQKAARGRHFALAP